MSCCSYETTNPRLLKLHQRRSHFEPQECPKCSKVITSYSAAAKHRKTHEVTVAAKKKYTCDECEFSCGDASTLRKHAACHGAKVIKCQHCDFRSGSPCSYLL